MTGKSHEEFMIERFREDPAYAVALLNSILDDGDDQGELRVFLRQMAAAFGIKQGEAENTSDIGNLVSTIRAMGLRLSVVVPEPQKPRRRAGTAKPAAPKRAVHARRSATKTSALS